ncbi:MAG: HAD family hydrolase [Promethearchaeota archaeon]|nr:MAG: HAD family hydrolase [Candidatus Lokiarchaeota archaeon]
MTIKALIFDLGDVLVELDFSNFYKKVASVSPQGENLLTPKMLEFFRQSDLYHQGKMNDNEFYKLACDIFQVCMLDQSEFYEAFNSIVSHPITEVVELLKKLKEIKKYKLIALSNVNASHWNYILTKNWKFLEYFDELILSYQLHMTKPDPKIFKYAVKKANCKPIEIVFIDDGFNNVRSAKELGMIGIHFTNVKMLMKEFEKLKIVLN